MIVNCTNCGLVYTVNPPEEAGACPDCGERLAELRDLADAHVARLEPLVLERHGIDGCSFAELSTSAEGREFLSWYFASSRYQEYRDGTVYRVKEGLDLDRVGALSGELLRRFEGEDLVVARGMLGDWMWLSPASDRSVAVKVSLSVMRLFFRKVETDD